MSMETGSKQNRSHSFLNFVTTKQLSVILSVPIGTLSYWRTKKRGPRYVKVGRHVRYDLSDISIWLDHRKKLTNV